MSLESFHFIDEEIQNLMSAQPSLETANSFTALLDLPPNQALKLLHSPEQEQPTSIAFASVFPAMDMESSPETTSSHNNSNLQVKQEPTESGSMHNSSPIFSDPEPVISKSTKRKDRHKVKSSAKKIAKETDREKLPYVHVRARRGEATDNHSLAERARREKINARMKLLQELVPGCSKISGTALVLDEIINHVQSLQLQVEFLSMKLAAVHPRVDINFDTLFTSESGSPMECNFAEAVPPPWWVDGQVNPQIWHPDQLTNFVTTENSHLSYDSSGNSGELGSTQ